MRMMFSRSEKKIYSPDFEFILRGTESNVCSISLPGNMNLSMTGLHCNGFSEDGCLTDKFRVHGQIDNFGAEAELFQTIPFGTEFKVKRRFECASSFIRMTLDVDPGKGAIENLKLDDIVLEGDLKTLKIFTAENKEMIFSESQLSEKVCEFYNSSLPPLAVQIQNAAGAVVEFGCGNDLWRHQTVNLYEACGAEFTISGNNKKIIFTRHALKFTKDSAIPKRAFRFKNYIAFAPAITFRQAQADIFTEKNCMSSAVARRNLRDFIRKFNGSTLQLEAENFLCTNAGHMERPGKEELLHWGVEDFFEIMLWGNKLLAGKKAALYFVPQKNPVANELTAMKILSEPLKNNIFAED